MSRVPTPVKVRFGGCYLCGVAKGETADHVIPRALGGGELRDNLLPACAPCNNQKGDREPTVCELFYREIVYEIVEAEKPIRLLMMRAQGMLGLRHLRRKPQYTNARMEHA